MHRRHLLSIAGHFGLAASLSQSATAQRAVVKRIGELNPFPVNDPQQHANASVYVDAFRQHGWEYDKNLVYDTRTGPRSPEGWEDATRELVAEGVDLIVAYTDGTIAAALRVTRTTPIVAISGAPVELGFAASLAKPGGNFTGVSFQAHDENGRAVALLRDIRPGLQRIGIPRNAANPVSIGWFESFEAAAALGAARIVALPFPMAPAEVTSLLDAAAREKVQALVLPILPFLSPAVWQQITAWAIEQQVITRGSLLSRGDAVLAFGANVAALLRLHAAQIDRVLRGARPADTPIVQPTQWDTVINQRLARAVGWPAPRSVLIQATEVIE